MLILAREQQRAQVLRAVLGASTAGPGAAGAGARCTGRLLIRLSPGVEFEHVLLPLRGRA
jgi:hypothetical protein